MENRYASIKNRLYFNIANKKHISELEKKIKENIIKGRSAKPFKDLKESIGYFKEAEKILTQLEDEVPTLDMHISRLKILIYLTIAVITGYLIAAFE